MPVRFVKIDYGVGVEPKYVMPVLDTGIPPRRPPAIQGCAEAQLAALGAQAGAIPADYGAGLNRLHDVLAVAVLNAKGRIALASGDSGDAIALMRQAVAKEDELAYAEPADWFFPSRHLLGAALLELGRAGEAEAVYREDLRRNPENGWALYGLDRALTAQARPAEGETVTLRFAAAWQRADIALTASAY